MGKIKIGIIGCGGIANSKHMPSLARHKDRCEIVSFCDLIPERAQQAAQKYGTGDAKVYTDYRQLLADPEIVLVHVCTPNRMHSQITVDALYAGKHVICEKPMAINTEEAQKMLDAQKITGKILTIGYQYRRNPHSIIMKRIAESGALGEIYYAKAHALRRRMVPNWGVFLSKEEQGGGPLIDCGTHALDLALWMMDNYEPEYVLGQTFNKLGTGLKPGDQANFFGDWDNESFEVEDSAFGMIKMKNGATIMLEASWAINMTEAKQGVCSLYGTKAGIEAFPNGKTNSYDIKVNNVVAGNLAEQLIPAASIFPGANQLNAGELEVQNILDVIEGKDELIVRPEQAFVVTKCLDAIYESSRTGQAVVFD